MDTMSEEPLTHQHRRKTDPTEGDILESLSILLSRYKVLWYAGVVFFVALGFGFKTPNAKFQEIDASHRQEMKALDSRVYEVERVIPLVETNAVIACLSISEREASQYGLPCRRLLEGRQLASPNPPQQRPQ